MQVKKPEVEDVSPKAVPGLEALEAQALASETEGQTEATKAAAKEAEKEVIDLAGDLSDALDMAAGLAKPALWFLDDQKFELLWGEKVRKQIAAAGAEIMRRHGLNMGDLFSKYGPYIALAGALGPSAIATVAAYKAATQKQLDAKPAP